MDFDKAKDDIDKWFDTKNKKKKFRILYDMDKEYLKNQ
jgi:hypothetical protein